MSTSEATCEVPYPGYYSLKIHLNGDSGCAFLCVHVMHTCILPCRKNVKFISLYSHFVIYWTQAINILLCVCVCITPTNKNSNTPMCDHAQENRAWRKLHQICCCCCCCFSYLVSVQILSSPSFIAVVSAIADIQDLTISIYMLFIQFWDFKLCVYGKGDSMTL